MKVTGVIAEYNPFHNGHKYLLEQLRQQTGADYIIVAMSGDFIQRGAPAVVDKYTRTAMALENGADLVVEIPALWSTASAEYFAQAGIHLLCETGVIDHIGYGVEQKQPKLLSDLVELLTNAPDAYDKEIAMNQREGLSYPASREAALIALLPEFEASQIRDFLKQPNNILALEYEKALIDWNLETGSSVGGVQIERIGDGYHEASVGSTYASATAIRKLLAEDRTQICAQHLMPEQAASLLMDASRHNLTRSANDFSSILYAKLLSEQEFGYEKYADCSHDLSCKIKKHLTEFISYDQFCMLLKSKDLTYTRISRVLLHIMLGITKENYSIGASHSFIAYLRALGFRKDATPLLSAIKENAGLPLVTKSADAPKIIQEDAYPLFAIDLYAADLYRGVDCICSGRTLPNEFTHEIVIV
jgi:predicted nucleotidyltransferase